MKGSILFLLLPLPKARFFMSAVFREACHIIDPVQKGETTSTTSKTHRLDILGHFPSFRKRLKIVFTSSQTNQKTKTFIFLTIQCL